MNASSIVGRYNSFVFHLRKHGCVSTCGCSSSGLLAVDLTPPNAYLAHMRAFARSTILDQCTKISAHTRIRASPCYPALVGEPSVIQRDARYVQLCKIACVSVSVFAQMSVHAHDSAHTFAHMLRPRRRDKCAHVSPWETRTDAQTDGRARMCALATNAQKIYCTLARQRTRPRKRSQARLCTEPRIP